MKYPRRLFAICICLTLVMSLFCGTAQTRIYDDRVTEGYVSLAFGACGRAVKALQQALMELGYYAGEASGDYDAATVNAVTSYQGRNGIKPSGTADAETQRRIYETSSRSSTGKSMRVRTVAPVWNATVQSGSTGDAVADLQKQLRSLGYSQVTVDGICGRITVNAVKDFQKKHGLYPDGIAGANTLSWIRTELGESNDAPVSDPNQAEQTAQATETAPVAEPAAQDEAAPQPEQTEAPAVTATAAPVSQTVFTGTLRSGSTGEAVAAMKTMLKELGYDPGAENDQFDAAAKAAVRLFQKDAGLKVDGVAGPATLGALKDAYDALLLMGRERMAWARTLAEESGAVCGTMLLTKDGKPFLTWSFGGVNSDTCFRIASITKWVTAIGLMTLYDQGKLDLDADISGYLPFPVRNPAFPDTPITARMLLTHTSSISAEAQNYQVDWGRIGKKGYDPVFDESLRPGEAYAYADMNGALFGALIEAITGESVQTYLQRTVFAPLGLTAAYTPTLLPEGTKTQSLLSPEGKVQISVQRDRDRGFNQKADPAGNLGYTVGRLYINASSLTRLSRMMLSGGELDGVRILKESTVALMEADQPNLSESPYGLSTVRLEQFPRGTWYGHQGRYSGLTSNVYYQRETGITMVLILDGYNYALEDNVVLPAVQMLRQMEALETDQMQ